MAGLAVASGAVAHAPGTFSGGIANVAGVQVIVDFYTWAMSIGAAFQVRAGTITTPLVGDVVITDAVCEMATAALAGTLLIPTSANISFRLAAGTLFESAGKSTAVATMSGGTAFVALPLKTIGPNLAATPTAAVTTSMVSAAGGVTVAAELATTTRRHFSWSQPIAAGAWPTWYDWAPRAAPHLAGPSCFYLQIAGAGTGPSYYASYDFIEMPTTQLLG